MKLYSYQERAIEAIESDPSHSQLISMPTGTGKTITFLNAAKRMSKRCLIIVHREELLNQTYKKAIDCGYDEVNISLICASKKEEIGELTISMVQTLSRNLDKYDASSIDMMIVDEAHHSTAKSYGDIFHHFKMFDERKKLLGFTATPLRGDKKLLGSIYNSHSFKMTLSEATQNGYICPVHGIRIDIKKSLENVDSSQGDYDLQQLDKIMNCDSINDVVVERCENLSKTPAIVFCTSVDHARILAKKLREKKRKAISVSYKTSKRALKIIYKWLYEGRIEFITNAVKLSEGFDYPPIQSIILVRPTRSPVLYKQMIGRGLRNFPGKYDCFVLEFSGNDPKMICWDDIDENSTFQSTTLKEKKSREEALNFYASRFKSHNVKVVDVRISPFNFYECRIQRIGKYKRFHYLCHDRGFTIFEYVSVSSTKLEWSGFNTYVTSFFWKKRYKIFYEWCESCWFFYQEGGRETHQYLEMIRWYARSQKLARWYPSEEEPLTGKHKKILKYISHSCKSARKAEMFLEDYSIKRIIEDYFLVKSYDRNSSIKGEVRWG